jgi:hypothetical protein
VRQFTVRVSPAGGRRVATGLVATGLLGIALCGSLATAAVAGASSNGSASLTQARKDLLTLSDMPSGWKSTKNTNTNNNSAGAAQLAHCVGVATSLIAENPPSVNSPQFQNAQGTLTVADNVTVFPSAKNAAAEYAIALNSKLPPCMTSLASGPLKAKLFGKTPKNTSLGTPLVSPIASTAFGAGIVGYSMSIPITTRGVTLNVTVTQLIAVKGRLGHQVSFTAVGAPFSLGLEKQIMAVASRQL